MKGVTVWMKPRSLYFYFLWHSSVLLGLLTIDVMSAPGTAESPVEIVKGNSDLDKIILRHPRGSSAEIYLYGSHVTSWKNENGEELLFLSNKSAFSPPKPIRGGIPICFPQFSNLGPLSSHGFARNRLWKIDPSPPPFSKHSKHEAFVDLLLKPTEEDLKLWPHSFEFRMRVALGPSGNLMLSPRIRNVDTKPFNFTFALHTYFSVSDISEVRIEGLETLDYLDNQQNRTRFTEQADAITFESEVDRIYLNTPPKVAILDHERKQTYSIHKHGLPEAVVWNPWERKSRTTADLGEGLYKFFVCCEAAAIEKPVTVKPGEEWTAKLNLYAKPSTNGSGQLDPQKVLEGN